MPFQAAWILRNISTSLWSLSFFNTFSDVFQELHAQLETEHSQGADPENQDKYKSKNSLWAPPETR